MEARLPSQLVLTAAQATAGTSAADVSSTDRYSALGTCSGSNNVIVTCYMGQSLQAPQQLMSAAPKELKTRNLHETAVEAGQCPE
jgi:hypothetical protein